MDLLYLYNFVIIIMQALSRQFLYRFYTFSVTLVMASAREWMLVSVPTRDRHTNAAV